MRVNLTPSFVAKAPKPENGKDRIIYWDESRPGFGLMVTVKGHRSFVVQYRNKAGQSRRAHLKNGFKLASARKEARAIQGDVARGADPIGAKKAEANQSTFKTIAEDYLKREGGKLRTLKGRRQVLNRLIYPAFGSKPIDEIKRSHITKLLDEVEDERGAPMADHTLTVVRRIMGWHASRDDDFRSPIVRGMSRSNPVERARKRILTDDEIRAAWAAADALGTPFARMVQFILLTGVRRTEAARMDRSELQGTVWTIPAARVKGKREFVIPLSEAALAVLGRLPVVGAADRWPVFTNDGTRPIAGFGQFKPKFNAACGVTDWVIHDLRRTARSLMSRAGANSDHAERALGHVIRGVRGIARRLTDGARNCLHVPQDWTTQRSGSQKPTFSDGLSPTD
jgi:integrase